MREKSTCCKNCNFEFCSAFHFCPNCGQESSKKIVSINLLFKDFIETYLTFDSKFFKTLLPLIFKPGFLTLEFSKGKRATYVPPIRFYIFISILYFFVLSLNGNDNEDGISSFLSPQEQNDSLTSMSNNISFMIDGDTISYDSSDKLLEDVNNHGGEKNFLKAINAQSFFEKIVVTQFIKIAKHQGIGLKNILLKNVSILLFFLLPIFALLSLLLFRKKQLLYVEHLVHALHIHTFTFILLSVYLLFSKYIWNIFSFTASSVIAGFYLYLSLKTIHKYPFWSTIWRMLILVPSYVLFLFIAFGIAISLSIALY